jgi:hypothetical protein
MEHEFKVIKLHDVPDVMEETALLLNKEWPRSLEARYASIFNMQTQVLVVLSNCVKQRMV